MHPTHRSRSPQTCHHQLRREGALALIIAAAAVAAVVFYRLEAGAGYPLDDSWIHLAYARNLAAGRGFGITAGVPSPGATAPLWVFLLAPGFLFGRVHASWPWLLGAAALAGAGLAALRLIRQWGDGSEEFRWAAFAGGLSLVLSGPLVWSAAGAMEVPLFALLTLATVLAFSTPFATPARRGGAWGALAGLAALARPEGLLLLPLAALLSLVRRPAPRLVEPLAGVGTGLALYAPSVVFCLATSGRPFPNTFYAKTTALVAGAPDIGFLAAALRFFFAASPVAVVALLLAVTAVCIGRRIPDGVLLALAFAVALPVAYAMMGRTYLFAGLAGNFGRYLYPALPPALVAGFWGFATLRRTAGRSLPAWVLPALLALAVVVTVAGTRSRAALFARNVRDINTMQVAMAQRLVQALPAGALVAANDVGALAYFGEFRILDLVGVVSTVTLEKLAAAGADPHARSQAILGLLREQQPAAIVVFPQWYREVLLQLRGRLVPLGEADNPDNVTSGGSRLVAFAVDWSR